jgi:hypothetical protein
MHGYHTAADIISDQMYKIVPSFPCVRMLNAQRPVGCSSILRLLLVRPPLLVTSHHTMHIHLAPGRLAYGTLRLVATDDHLDGLLTAKPDYQVALVVQYPFFNTYIVHSHGHDPVQHSCGLSPMHCLVRSWTCMLSVSILQASSFCTTKHHQKVGPPIPSSPDHA